MLCPKCLGLMVSDAPIRYQATLIDASESEVYDSCRCLNCGYIHDPVVLKNRALQQAAQQSAEANAEFNSWVNFGRAA